MNIIEKATKISERSVCDRCLGRQFGQLLSGYSNKERGRVLRTIVAMSIDKEDYEGNIDLSNFIDYKFHNLEIKKPKPKRCFVCNDFFKKIDKWAEKISNKAKKNEFKTFLVGTKLSFDLLKREEELWEKVGIDYCEPLKAEINREIGKLIEKKIKARFSPKPDVDFIIDLENNRIETNINPLFIYGEYQKLIRGIPQTKWPSKKYRTSIEEIIAKPFMLITKGKGHKLHGMGREDIDARCLAWRPFVLEIISPKKREIDFRKISKKINKRIKVRKFRLSSIDEVRKIKEARVDKTYLALINCDKSLDKNKLKALNVLKEIKQKTPLRVIHRRADRFRKRLVKDIKIRYTGKKEFELMIKAEAGLYIKELITGDKGRTRPSVSEILGCRCNCKQLDVIKIHLKMI